MSYTFLPKPEIVRSLFLAVASPLALAAVTVNQSDLSNPRIWLTGVAIGCAHALGAALLTAVSQPQPSVPPAPVTAPPVTVTPDATPPAPTVTTTSAPGTPPTPSETAPSA